MTELRHDLGRTIAALAVALVACSGDDTSGETDATASTAATATATSGGTATSTASSGGETSGATTSTSGGGSASTTSTSASTTSAGTTDTDTGDTDTGGDPPATTCPSPAELAPTDAPDHVIGDGTPASCTAAALAAAVSTLGEQNEHLREAREEALAASQAKSDFLANMSHELRTPMSAILGVADLLREHPLDSEDSEYVEMIRSSGDILLTLLNDILDLSKIE
ncbi:MAG: hypothetical protein KC420_11450, partial [Myxococcales bacterium]|nr:hypothetical protein [Myxococcales bacterium]